MKIAKINILLAFGLTAIIMILNSCDDLQELNYDKKRLTDGLLSIDANDGGFFLPSMQTGIMDATGNPVRYEKQQYLNANNYAGYTGYPVSVYDGRNNMSYVMIDDWNNMIWTVPSSSVFNQWVSMKKKGLDSKYPDLFAIATIFKVFSGHRLADVFGPIPYSLYGTASEVPFDSIEEIYNIFFEELREAVRVLRLAIDENPSGDKTRYSKFDKSKYGGDYATWIRVANTLRLRLAIRISNANPVKAKKEAEDAVKEKEGLLTPDDEAFEIHTGTVHPLYTITQSWGEASLNASLESYLLGYNDPRLAVFAKPATHPAFENQFKGVRSGASYDNGFFAEYSRLNFDNNPYVKVMDVSESFFLRAEGALKGWDMGASAQELYEMGIRTSFATHGVEGVDEYINNQVDIPLDYVDLLNDANNAQALSTITIKWDESASDEEKLEKIITQKWIALFPDGMEAWSEFRRTGFPKLFPVVQNYSNGEVPDGEFIKRIPYPPNITNASQNAVDEAVDKYLGGKDGMFVPLWWDVN